MSCLQSWQAHAPPGVVREYSNLSIGRLGAVTAAAPKDRCASLVETRLLRKVGMSQSHLHVPAAAMADYAWGYREGLAVRVHPGPLDEPTYGIKSTAAGMLRFVQANLDPSRLDVPLRRAVEATRVGYFRFGGMVPGLGWEEFPYPPSRACSTRPARPADSAPMSLSCRRSGSGWCCWRIEVFRFPPVSRRCTRCCNSWRRARAEESRRGPRRAPRPLGNPPGPAPRRPGRRPRPGSALRAHCARRAWAGRNQRRGAFGRVPRVGCGGGCRCNCRCRQGRA